MVESVLYLSTEMRGLSTLGFYASKRPRCSSEEHIAPRLVEEPRELVSEYQSMKQVTRKRQRSEMTPVQRIQQRPNRDPTTSFSDFCTEFRLDSKGLSEVWIKKLMIAEASLRVVSDQFAQTQECCGICQRGFNNITEMSQCKDALHKRIVQLEKRKEGLITKGEEEKQASASSEAPAFSPTANHLRNGFFVFFRQLKAAILTKRRCPACKKDIDTIRLAELLSRFDRISYSIKKRTH